jgi:hypothetical protein
MVENENVLSLALAHGLSPIRNCVVNLSNRTAERLFFVSSNTAVIQVCPHNQDALLFGASSVHGKV